MVKKTARSKTASPAVTHAGSDGLRANPVSGKAQPPRQVTDLKRAGALDLANAAVARGLNSQPYVLGTGVGLHPLTGLSLARPSPGASVIAAAPVPAAVHKIASAADLGRLLRAARDERGLSQQAFADLAGVGRRFVSELENGKATLEFDKVLSVAAAAGIDLFARRR